MIQLRKPPAFPQLSSKRLKLREARPGDAEAYHEILSFPELCRYSDLPIKPGPRRSERFVSWMSKLHTRGTGCAWLLELRRDGAIIGAIRINSIEKKVLCGMIGYEVHPEHWGKGYASEALGAVTRHAHGVLELNRLEAWTTPGNDASDRVLVKNGFAIEGIQRQKIRLANQLHDLRLFARLKSDELPDT